MIQCKECQSDTIVKNGIVPKKQRYKCKSCGCNFIIGDSPLNPATQFKRQTGVLFYSLGQASCRFLAKLLAVSPATTYQWVGTSAETLAEPVVSAAVKEIEIDQRWHFLHSKNKRWIIKALDRNTGTTMARVVGGRDAATVRRLYGQLEHLNDCLFYTDDGDAWAKVLPPERRVRGKKYTIAIEPDNSNTGHHLGRMS